MLVVMFKLLHMFLVSLLGILSIYLMPGLEKGME